jgi:coenzyme F420-reducing hydrogenase gamma subunit
MSLLDIDERLFELLERVEFDRSPLTDIKHCGPCDIGLIEGGCATPRTSMCCASSASSARC